METLGHARHSEGSRRACLEDLPRLQAGETTPTSLGRGEMQDHRRGDSKAFWRPDSSRKCTTQSGLPIPFLYERRGGNEGCVLTTGLNKACPKDPFPLPRIDQIVDSTSGCKTLCFLDAYSGYHQNAMESDQLATSFITLFGSFCYVSMPFGLKNVGATYQRCMLR